MKVFFRIDLFSDSELWKPGCLVLHLHRCLCFMSCEVIRKNLWYSVWTDCKGSISLEVKLAAISTVKQQLDWNRGSCSFCRCCWSLDSFLTSFRLQVPTETNIVLRAGIVSVIHLEKARCLWLEVTYCTVPTRLRVFCYRDQIRSD